VEISTAEWMAAGQRLTAVAANVVGRRYRENYDVFTWTARDRSR